MHLDSRWTLENHLDSSGVHLEYVGQGKVLHSRALVATHVVRLLLELDQSLNSRSSHQYSNSVLEDHQISYFCCCMNYTNLCPFSNRFLHYHLQPPISSITSV